MVTSYQWKSLILKLVAAEKDSAMLTSLLNSELEESANTGIDIDLRIYTRLGAIYHLSLLEMPPQPKVIKGWTIRQVKIF